MKDIIKGGEHIKYESSIRLVLNSKVKQRALKIKNILDERNKR
jgi:hypothetical protein